MTPVLEGEAGALLESGCSLIVALLDGEGEPFASRGWGLDVIDPGVPRVRVLLGAGELGRLHPPPTAEGGWALAITGADVRTLRSVQLKGRAERLEPATAADTARAERYCDGFFDAVVATDGTSRALLERLAPTDLVACVATVSELYDQTPGPGAGSAVR